MTEIDIDLEDQATVELWPAVGELAERLPGQWALIGGPMVQLHALEHSVSNVRPMGDIDVLGQARPPGALGLIDTALRGEGFELVGPDLDGYGYRYERDGLIVDALAPDGINPPPDLGVRVLENREPGRETQIWFAFHGQPPRPARTLTSDLRRSDAIALPLTRSVGNS